MYAIVMDVSWEIWRQKCSSNAPQNDIVQLETQFVSVLAMSALGAFGLLKTHSIQSHLTSMWMHDRVISHIWLQCG